MKIISIIIKDLKIILSDKKALAIMILMPIILTTILSFALKGSFISDDDISIGVVDIAVVKLYNEKTDSKAFKNSLRNSIISQGMEEGLMDELANSGSEVNPEDIFFKDFLSSEELSKFISYRVVEENEGLKLLKDGKISAVVLLPEKFIYDMKINLLTPFRNKINIEIITHPDKNISGEIVKSVIKAYSSTMSSVIIGKNVLLESVIANNTDGDGFNNIDELMEEMKDVISNINVNIENFAVKGRRHITSADYYAVAMMTMFILFASGQGGRMLLEEKDNLTYGRMIVAGTSKTIILLGKLITVFLIAIIQIAVMIIFSYFALKVQWGDFSLILLVSISAAFAVAGLGILVGALTFRTGNYKIANAFESAIIYVMALLGGSFFPIDVMPKAIQKLDFLSINGIALKAYLKIILGYGFNDIRNYIYILVSIGFLFSFLSLFSINKKEEVKDVKHNKTKTIKA